jgi:hypothetical protein
MNLISLFLPLNPTVRMAGADHIEPNGEDDT